MVWGAVRRTRSPATANTITISPPSCGEQGFITFSPQGLFIFEDRFRTLQRKANPWARPCTRSWCRSTSSSPTGSNAAVRDPARIAFYGLSYGGKSAMRVPALVTNLLPVHLLGRLQ